MRSAKIFNGKEFITVTENQTFRLDGVWNWDEGSTVVFQVEKGIEVETTVQYKDSLGSVFLVTEIKTLDEYSEISVEAEDVDIEIIKNSEEQNVKFDKPRFTKRELIEFIVENNIDIDIKGMTKADIVDALTEMGYM